MLEQLTPYLNAFNVTLATIAAIALSVSAITGHLSIVFKHIGAAFSFVVSSVRRRQPIQRLRFFPGLHYSGEWSPTRLGGRDALQIHIRLEASNMTPHPLRLMSARLRWMPSNTTTITVKDLNTGYHGHAYPIAPGAVVPVTVTFFCLARRPWRRKLHATLLLTDHLGGVHKVKVSLSGPRG